MSNASSFSLPLPGDEVTSGDSTQQTTPNGKREVHWRVVAQTAGLLPAQIMVGRLQAEGVPARAWQEGAGQAHGLIVGKLGTGHVEVPEEYAEEATRILNETEEEQGHQ